MPIVFPLTLVTCTICDIRKPVPLSPHHEQVPFSPDQDVGIAVSPWFCDTMIQSVAGTAGHGRRSGGGPPFVTPARRLPRPPKRRPATDPAPAIRTEIQRRARGSAAGVPSKRAREPSSLNAVRGSGATEHP